MKKDALTWGSIAILDLKSWSPMSAILMPSIVMWPFSLSIRRNKAMDSDDFPAPVRPTIPILKQSII